MPGGKKILVIDDDTSTRQGLKELLEPEGYEVISAANGNEGLALARNVHPDLVILDVMFPSGSGLSIYEQLKKTGASGATPVLVYTSAPSMLLSGKVPESDKPNIISKGTDIKELLDIIRKRLEPSPH